MTLISGTEIKNSQGQTVASKSKLYGSKFVDMILADGSKGFFDIVHYPSD